MLGNLFVLFFILVWVIGFLGLILSFKYFRFLQFNYPEKWKKLGEPGIFNYSMGIARKVKQFEYQKEFLELKNLQLNSMINFRIKLKKFYLGIFLITILLFFIQLFNK